MTKRDGTVLMVVAGFALLLVYWFMVLGPKRDDAKTLKDQVAKAQSELTAAQQTIAASRAAKSRYTANYSTVARLGKAVPADDDVDALVVQLDAAAKATDSDFRSIALSTGGVQPVSAVTSAQAVAATQDPAKAPVGATGQTGATGAVGATGATGAAGATGVAAAQALTAGLPPGASVGPAGLLTMPFTFAFGGTFNDLASFFNRIEHFTIPKRNGALEAHGRLITIDGIALIPNGYPDMKATVIANTFLLPADQGLFAGATPAAPARSNTQSVNSLDEAATPPAISAAVTGVGG